ncbi:MAG: DNA cytosine methyltransferase [Okeania sp. SIO3I5]|uniref:DNA cytosine methyltransferase n=1 Tax=Okeania sp. SIO3I5 TaxID=2607805 RepID=UPI0013BD5E2D|nr:DNA cytosine methyltransferase [Okeania sp. SIO3I5]NEQ39761.1 DNA cytosine methyltransferase [Okeania sp. SIO3I5]
MIGISAVDLFCGAGGLTHGFEKAGLPVNVGYDIDPICKFPYQKNNKAKFIEKSVENIKGIELAKHFPEGHLKVIAGCAPCQPFSNYSRRYDLHDGETEFYRSSKWKLLDDFARLVKGCMPDIVTMENVPQLQKHQVFEKFITKLEELKYFVTYYEVKCQDYGIPQARRRLVFFASKFGNIDLIPPTYDRHNYKTVRDTIEHLEPLKAGQSSKTDPLHQCSKLSALNLRRIRASKPGGTWRDWPEDLIAKCHTKKSGKSYPSVYGRMEWDSPSPTITTQCFGFGNGRFGHPKQDRAISLREAALLQTFPKKYQFFPPNESFASIKIGRLIGNAVPVKLGEVVAKSILNHIQEIN